MGEIVRVLVIVNGVLVSAIFSPLLVRGLSFPSLSTITQETVGRGNPSTEQLNIATAGANTVRSIGGVVMLGRAVYR